MAGAQLKPRDNSKGGELVPLASRRTPRATDRDQGSGLGTARRGARRTLVRCLRHPAGDASRDYAGSGKGSADTFRDRPAALLHAQ